MPSVLAALEIGGTHVTAGLVASDAWRVDPASVRRYRLSAGASASRIVAQLVAAANALGARPGTDWGVALPGPFDYRRGVGLYRDVGKFDSLRGHDLRASLGDGLSVRPGRLTFVNDAEAYLLGEWLVGAAKGAARCVGLTVGTGIGSAFLAEGRIVDTGPAVPPGGSLHRVTVDGCPLEDRVSRRAILRRYAEQGGRPGVDVRDVAESARAADALAASVLGDAMRALGEAAAPWLRSFEAEVVVVGGSMAASWDLIGEPLRAGIAAGGAPDLPVTVAAYPETSPLVGAALTAMRA